MPGADLVQEALELAHADADVLALELDIQLLRLGHEPELDRARDHLGKARIRLQACEGRRVAQRRRHAWDELGDRELRHAVLAERRQHVRDVLHEGAVRADDEHAAARVLLPLGVDQPRGAVEADRGLAGAGTALDHQRPLGRAGDQAVLVCLNRCDDVAHVRVSAALELIE